MDLSFTEKKSIRKSFGKLKEILSIPNLIDVQKKSYQQFLNIGNVSEINLQKNVSGTIKLCYANRSPLALCLTPLLHGGKIA